MEIKLLLDFLPKKLKKIRFDLNDLIIYYDKLNFFKEITLIKILKDNLLTFEENSPVIKNQDLFDINMRKVLILIIGKFQLKKLNELDQYKVFKDLIIPLYNSIGNIIENKEFETLFKIKKQDEKKQKKDNKILLKQYKLYDTLYIPIILEEFLSRYNFELLNIVDLNTMILFNKLADRRWAQQIMLSANANQSENVIDILFEKIDIDFKELKEETKNNMILKTKDYCERQLNLYSKKMR